MLTSPDGGALIRVIAGDLEGHPGPGSTYTPITVLHATISPGASVTLPWNPEFNALAYVLNGDATVGTDNQPIGTGQTALFGAGGSVTIRANEKQDARHPNVDVLLLGGAPIREPVVAYGPFVMNTKAEIQQAVDDFNAGKLGVIPAHAHVGGSTEE